MRYKVLVVDDSGFFRRRVTDIIASDMRLEVIGTADNGLQAIEKAEKLKPDVITMDYEMPMMDGVTAVEHIMANNPTPVLMFSSLTFEGARVTLNALDAGAVDFLSKNFDEIANNDTAMRKRLTGKIVEVAQSQIKGREAPVKLDGSPVGKKTAGKAAADIAPVTLAPKRTSSKPELLMIGTSTGGPAALQTIFKAIDKKLNVPVIIVQHMPGSFTQAFSERLNKHCKALEVKEAQDGDKLEAGKVYVAPGGKQLIVDKRMGGTLHIRESDERMNYKPSVDLAFASAAKHFGDKTLAIMLTGMGSDGLEGSKMLAKSNCNIWAQDEASCVIYGMPAAVVNEGLATQVETLKEFAAKIMAELS